MAQLVGGVVGAVVGSFVGMPQLGFLVGSMIGGAVDRAMNPIITEGPRIGDLNVSSSAYGNPKPILYGTARLPGQIIWTDGIRETRVVKKSKGKGGQPTKQISYQYSASVALGLCEGPVSGFIRIWMDGKLAYDRDGTGILSNNRFTLRTYLGDETQLPDGLISQNVGSNVSPAYRGLAYVVLEDLQLEPFGNRIPSITVEVTNNITPVDYKVDVPFAVTPVNQSINGTRIDRYRDLIVKMSYFPPYGADARTDQKITVFDMDGNVVISKTVDEIFASGSLSSEKFASYFSDTGLLVVPGEYLYLLTRDSANKTNLHRLNINSLEVIESFISQSNLGMISSNLSLPSNINFFPEFSGYQMVFDEAGEMTPFFGLAQYPANNGNYTTIKGGKFMKIVDGHERYFNGVDETSVVPGFDPAPNIGGLNSEIQFIPGEIRVGESDAYWICFDGGLGFGVNNDMFIKKMNLTPFSAFDVESLSNTNVNTTWQFVDRNLLTAAFGSAINVYILSVCHDPADDTLIFLTSANASPTYLFKYKFDTNEILWVTQVSYTTTPWTRFNIHWSESDLSFGTVGLPNFAGFALDTATGAIIYNTTATPSNKHNAAVWDSKMFGGYGIATSTNLFEKFYFNRATSGTVTLKTIVDDLCRRGGLTPAQVDTTNLNSVNVKGYVVARPTTAKATLDQLSSAFFIKSVESDGKIKFYLKSAASSVATIPQRWLASQSSEGNFWAETRRQELELPKKITVTHINPDDDYQQGAQFQQRITNPYPSSWGNSEVTIEMPMVLYPGEAKIIATNMLYTSWSERVSYNSILPWKYLALDPTDTVVVSMDDGENFGVRISATTLGANFHIETAFVGQDVSTYSAPTVYNAGGSLGFVPQEIVNLTMSRIVFMDIPLIKDQDQLDATSTRVYFGANPYKTGWPGGSLDISFDSGISFDVLEEILDPIVSGSVSGKLPTTVDANIIDYTTILTVYLNNPSFELDSISTDLFLSGVNVALIGQELIYFKDAVLQIDGSYLVSTIMRGRRGTEWACNLHDVGEEFYLLNDDSNSVIKEKLPLSTVNNSYYYRLTTFGMYASEGMVNQNKFTGVAERPYSPANIYRTMLVSGDNITWDRRNRINGSFIPLADIPQYESPETYDIYILSSAYDPVASNWLPPTTFVRKYTSSTPDVLYTTANMTTDGFNRASSTLHLVIFQISPTVGPGYPGHVSIPAPP